ncbi:hypothetical protein XENOCAPTIV_011938, partial [Xenoophorus captivus]
ARCETQIQLGHSQTSCTATPTEEGDAAPELEPSDGTATEPRLSSPKDGLEQGSSSGAPEGLDVPEEEDTVLLAVGLEIQGFQEQGDMSVSFRRLPSKICFAGVVRDPSPRRRCVSPTVSQAQFPHKCICTKSPQFGCVECVSEHYSCSKCLYVCSKRFNKDSFFYRKKSKSNGCRRQPNEVAPLSHVGRGQHRSANSAAGQSPSCTSPYVGRMRTPTLGGEDRCYGLPFTVSPETTPLSWCGKYGSNGPSSKGSERGNKYTVGKRSYPCALGGNQDCCSEVCQ